MQTTATLAADNLDGMNFYFGGDVGSVASAARLPRAQTNIFGSGSQHVPNCHGRRCSSTPDVSTIRVDPSLTAREAHSDLSESQPELKSEAQSQVFRGAHPAWQRDLSRRVLTAG